MGAFLAEGIKRSEAMLAVTTATNIELLREHLGNDARSVEFVDVEQLLQPRRSPRSRRYRSFSDTSSQATAPPGFGWSGEPMWAERSDAEVRLWTRYESLFNLVFAAYPMTVVCPYDERSVAPEIVSQACLTHPHVLGERGISHSPGLSDPGLRSLEPY